VMPPRKGIDHPSDPGEVRRSESGTSLIPTPIRLRAS
jgi:hypothetical protein